MPSGGVAKTNVARTFDIPSLDGIRAIAVLTVFVGHGFTVPEGFPGHVGVTIFFFLSGFLITTLLRRERDKTGTFSLGKFYLRRSLRILPPTYVLILASLAAVATGVVSAKVSVMGVLSEVFMFTNYFIVFGDQDALPPQTSQLWSLAVEEHYYLVFPALVLVLLALKLTLRQIGWALLGLCVLVLAWRIYLANGELDFYRLYVSTDTRFDILVYGSAMALLVNPVYDDPFPGKAQLQRWIPTVIAPAAVVIFIAVAATQSLYFRLVWADVILGACMVPIFWTIITRSTGPVTTLLNNRIVAHIGVLSFSIYLFHKLVFAVVGKVVHVAPVADILALIGTIAVAEVVYLMVEKPCGRLRRKLEAHSRFSRPQATNETSSHSAS
jgi:peptidoglycan/LPS O-acetylase OafA/YrhL